MPLKAPNRASMIAKRPTNERQAACLLETTARRKIRARIFAFVFDGALSVESMKIAILGGDTMQR